MRSGLALGLAFAGGLAAAKLAAFPPVWAQEKAAEPPAAAVATNPRERGLDALVYVQSAAEYRACCLQTYRLAAEKLKLRLAAAPPTNKLPAVVMDLDETVLDNSAFNVAMDRAGRGFRTEDWLAFERDGGGEVRLVPGAEDFVKSAIQMGASIVFISNRSHANKAATEAIVQRLLPVSFELQLAKDTTDKTARRAAAAAKYRVAMWIGDQLTDFDAAFALDKTKTAADAVARRALHLEERQHRLGDEWFLLPNPLYGEWLKPGEATSDAARQLLRSPAPPKPAN
jgi:5'-nucleotidase (lipoprotein e(P4) family)